MQGPRPGCASQTARQLRDPPLAETGWLAGQVAKAACAFLAQKSEGQVDLTCCSPRNVSSLVFKSSLSIFVKLEPALGVGVRPPRVARVAARAGAASSCSACSRSTWANTPSSVSRHSCFSDSHASFFQNRRWSLFEGCDQGAPARQRGEGQWCAPATIGIARLEGGGQLSNSVTHPNLGCC